MLERGLRQEGREAAGGTKKISYEKIWKVQRPLLHVGNSSLTLSSLHSFMCHPHPHLLPSHHPELSNSELMVLTGNSQGP